jgi:mannose-6-phosphate isomerase-like protein (cupin superfamily)
VSFLRLTLDEPVAHQRDTTIGALPGVGARFVMDGGDADGRFGLIEHPIGPRGLACPLHLHTREDEYSFVLEGRWGFQLGDRVVYADPGDLVYKPRDVWHSFWNASDEPARLLEIISPSGFEHYFVELAELLAAGVGRDTEEYAALSGRYGLQMDFASVPQLVASHGLVGAPRPGPD